MSRIWTGHEWVSRSQPDALRATWKRLIEQYGLDVPQLLAAARIIDGLLDHAAVAP